ncbi:Uncharacterised protein [Mycobacteroides abscessus subsp. abscessus]|uniref:hypothetical protein n=1 Tax=Mycobacteroides abscessus TaxID=36809 RepID=UPI000925AA48|nr:hypothetical protein [Mycobacteroides abscessus]SIH26022.1 Uncharacterised protein [Mycobacteroides abscessus subsp. abscessus]
MGQSFVLEVSGTFTSGVGVDFSAADGQALTHVDLPWRHETAPTPTGLLYISAVHMGDEAGELTCRILRDGQVIAAMTNNGKPNPIARVSAHVSATLVGAGIWQSDAV